MFGSIVVGTDGSDTAKQAVAQAAALAKTCGAHVHLVSAYRTTGQALLVAPMAEGMVSSSGPTDSEIAAEVEGVLREAAEAVSRDGVEVSTYACPGGAAEAILDVAAHQDADLIVVGNKGMQGARRVLGSVPNSISHKAACSVLIINTK